MITTKPSTSTGVIPVSAAGAGEGLKRRQAQPQESSESAKKRAREVTDFFWRLSSYLFLACACGAILKMPPKFGASQVKCPRCSRMHSAEDFKDKAPGDSESDAA